MKTSFHGARSIRYVAFVTTISAVSAVQACSGDIIPTAPSSVTREPASEPSQIRVSGTVTDDDGVPVSGVILKVTPWNGQPLSAVTDGTGFYRISVLPAAGISVLTEKEGYVSAMHTHTLTRGNDFQWDLRIYRIRPSVSV